MTIADPLSDFLITILRFFYSCCRASDSDFERLGFSCITFKFSISLVKLSMHFIRRGSIFFSGGFQLDLFTFNRCLGMPNLLECLKKYLIFSFLPNSLTDSNIGGLVIFGVGTNERPRSSNWRSVLESA